MFFTRHNINPRKQGTASDLLNGNYPIALTLEKFLDIYNDVSSFEYSLSSIKDTVFRNYTAASLTEALSNLGSDTSEVYSVAGETTREIIELGLESGVLPNAQTEYPLHTGKGLVIDFGKTLFRQGLFYPHLTLFLGDGLTNQAVGVIAGYVVFEGYGDIPIYNSDETKIATIVGRIAIKSRFSDLRPESSEARVGQTVTFRSSSSIKNLDKFSVAYMGSAKAETAALGESITFTVPQNAKSGPVRFEATDPRFNAFRSYSEIRILP